MNPRLHVLLVEDSDDDARLLLRELTRGGYDIVSRRVETADALERALADEPWQVVLCDYSLPSFSGDVALNIVKASGLDLPFIYVSGTMGEDIAVEAMKAGAHDYVMKNNLTRLVPAVQREVREAGERKEAQTALRQSQQAYASLVNTIEGIVWEADAATLRFSFVSQQAERLLGYPTERWLVEPTFWQDHVHPDDRDWALDFCRDSASRRESHAFKYRMLAADGRVVWLHDLVTVVAEAGRPLLLRGIMVDVTEARRAEEALRASEQRFRQVTENIDEVFWLTDVDKHELIYISPAYSRVWDRTCESLISNPQSWIDAIHPEDRARVKDAALTLQASGGYDLEYRIVRPDGGLRWVHDRAFPIGDPAGRVYRIAGVAEDITNRRQLEDQLRHSQKMEAIGQLAGGVAHDFNNLLTVIQMQSSLLLTESASGAELKEGLQQILDAAKRAANLTRQLLTFSRRDVRHAKDLDLAEVAASMTKLLRRLLGADVLLETHFAPDLPLVNADPGMMEQVLMNLAVNARDAMAGGGELAVSLDVAEIGDDYVAAHPQTTRGRFVRLRVSDTGCGILPEDLPRIFEPFFTTKEAGKGTGLGLATVFGIVEQHHGWVDVATDRDRGTTFEIFLPALEASASPSRDAARASGLPTGSESILVVEDDASVRALARVSLESCGYRVVEAESAAAALELWGALTAPVDLLLTDLIMPGGMSGRELAERLLQRQPRLKVVYTSGYSHDVVHGELHLSAGHNFLQKPYPVSDLAATVRRCLDEA